MAQFVRRNIFALTTTFTHPHTHTNAPIDTYKYHSTKVNAVNQTRCVLYLKCLENVRWISNWMALYKVYRSTYIHTYVYVLYIVLLTELCHRIEHQFDLLISFGLEKLFVTRKNSGWASTNGFRRKNWLYFKLKKTFFFNSKEIYWTCLIKVEQKVLES